MTSPLISVILPTYNRMAFLPQTVESILSQTITDFELIIINDGSIDGTDQWIKKQSDKRIKYIRCIENRGPSYARNKGLDLAQGKYIAFADSDDINEKARFKEQIKILEADKQLAICSTGIHIFYNKNVHVIGLMKSIYNKFRYKPLLPFRIKALIEIPFHFPACMVRHSFLKQENIRFRPEMQSADDYYFVMKIISKGKAYVIDKPLYHYRCHKDSITVGRSSEQNANSMAITQLAIKEILKLDLTNDKAITLARFLRGNLILSEEIEELKDLVQKVIDFTKQSADLNDIEKRSLINFLSIRISRFDKNWFRLFFFIKKWVRNHELKSLKTSD